jgi:hypothetical protein
MKSSKPKLISKMPEYQRKPGESMVIGEYSSESNRKPEGLAYSNTPIKPVTSTPKHTSKPESNRKPEGEWEKIWDEETCKIIMFQVKY